MIGQFMPALAHSNYKWGWEQARRSAGCEVRGSKRQLGGGGMGDCEVESDNTYAEASLLPLQEHHANIMAAAGYNHHGEFLGQKNRFLLSLVMR